MTVGIHFMETSQVVEFPNVINTYTKGGLYCLDMGSDGKTTQHVLKFPLCNIFEIIEGN